MKDTESQSQQVGEVVEVPENIKGKSLRTGHTDVENLAGGSESAPQERAASQTYVSDFAGDVHSYIREFIVLADQKAAFLFATVAAMLAYLQANGVGERWLKDPSSWDFGSVIASISVLGLVVGAMSALLAVLPQLGGNPTGLLF